jgi:predicted DNA-binding protein
MAAPAPKHWASARDKKTISFRLAAGKVGELDELGKAQARDRTFLLNEAVEAYLEV